jgi:lipoyl(octanoyl) transferase
MENQPILNPTTTSALSVEDWGLIDIEKATERQVALVEKVAAENLPGYLILCTHPPVVTKGRATKSDDIFAWQGNTIESSRGGRATYHGPSQIVVYPIINLKFETPTRPARDVVGYLRIFENAIVKTLSEFGIESVGRSTQKNANTNSEADETGVWVGSQKIASLGIAVKKWVTYHGAALNFSNDPQAFQGINPCGFQRSTMVSVEELLPGERTPARAQFQKALTQNLFLSFS